MNTQTLKNRQIVALSFALFFVFGVSNVYYLLLLYLEQVGVQSLALRGWVLSAFYMTSTLSRPFFSNFVERLGFRRLFLIAGSTTLASTIGIALCGANISVLIAFRLVLGLGASLYVIGLSTLQAVLFEEHERGAAYSLTYAGGLAPMMTLLPLADWFLKRQWAFGYISIPVFVAAGAFITCLLIPGVPEQPREAAGKAKKVFSWDALRECFAYEQLVLLFISMFLFGYTDASSVFLAPVLKKFGLLASLFLSSNALIGVIIRVCFRKVLDRYPRKRLASATTCITAGTLFLATVSPTPTTLVVLGAIYGIGMGFGFPLHLALAVDTSPEHLRPQAIALTWFFMGICFMTASVVLSFLAGFIGEVASFRIVSLAMFAGGVFMHFRWKKATLTEQ